MHLAMPADAVAPYVPHDMTLTPEQRQRVVEIIEAHPWGDFVRVEDFVFAMSRLHEALSPYLTGDDDPSRGEWTEEFDEFSVPPERVAELSEAGLLTYVAQLVSAAAGAYEEQVVDLMHDLHAVVLSTR